MIAANEECEVRSNTSAGVVFVEIANGAVFGGYRHGRKVVGVANGLEVAADDEEVDAGPLVDTAGLGDGGVDGVECAMALKREGVNGVFVTREEDSHSLQLLFAWWI